MLQLRKRRIDKVVLAGMSANLCLESHLRELLGQGFEVAGRDPEATQYVMQVNGGNQTVPTVVFSDGTALTNPSLQDVLARVGA